MQEKNKLKKSRIILLITTLSSLEMKRFNRFLQSKYFNKNPDLIKLFEVLYKYYPEFNSTQFTEQYIFKQVYGKGRYNTANIQDAFSKLLRLLESFLIDCYLDQQQQKRAMLLTEALSERLYLYYQQKTQKMMNQINAKGIWATSKDFYDAYQLAHQAWYHPETEKLTNDDSLLKLSQKYLDDAYLLEKLSYIAAISSRTTFLNSNIQSELAELRQQFANRPALANNEYKLLFEEVIIMHEKKDLASYQNFKRHLFSVAPNLKIEYRRNFLLHLINFGINFRLKAEGITIKEIFELYQLGVQERLFVKNGYIRDIEFTNICITGFRLGQDTWVTHFIEDHITCLKDREKEYLLPLVLAYQKLFNKDFEGLIDLLRGVQPKQSLKYLSRIQSLLIRAFFECRLHNIGDYEQVLTAYLTNLKKLMERNQKNTTLKIEAHLNFVKMVKQLMLLLNNPFNKNTYAETASLIANTNPLIFKDWLIEKLKDLEKTAFKQDLKAV